MVTTLIWIEAIYGKHSPHKEIKNYRILRILFLKLSRGNNISFIWASCLSSENLSYPYIPTHCWPITIASVHWQLIVQQAQCWVFCLNKHSFSHVYYSQPHSAKKETESETVNNLSKVSYLERTWTHAVMAPKSMLSTITLCLILPFIRNRVQTYVHCCLSFHYVWAKALSCMSVQVPANIHLLPSRDHTDFSRTTSSSVVILRGSMKLILLFALVMEQSTHMLSMYV